MTSFKVIPPRNAARYQAGEIIHRDGSKSEAEILALVNFGGKPTAQRENLQRAIASGWLVSVAGVVSCGATATAHYQTQTRKAAPVVSTGLPVPPRFINLMDRPELSRKYIPSRRGPRADALDNSLAVMPSHFGKGNP